MGYRLGRAFLSEVEEDPNLVSLKLKRGGPMVLIADDRLLAVMLSEKEYQALLEKEHPQVDPGREVPDSCAQDFQSLRACCCTASGRLYYYTKAYWICGKSYILCNRWREHPHRKTFQKWLQKFYEN